MDEGHAICLTVVGFATCPAPGLSCAIAFGAANSNAIAITANPSRDMVSPNRRSIPGSIIHQLIVH